jgi:hypothetical protein
VRTFQKVLFFLTAGALILSPASTAAQVTGFVENQPQLSNGSRGGQVHLYLEGTFEDDGKLGYWTWGLVNRDWAEALVGLGYELTEWCVVQAGAGLETDSSDARWAANLWLGHGRWSMLAMSEYGGSGHWRRVVVNADVGRWGLGGMHQNDQGLGPRLEYRFNGGRPGAILWAATLVNTDGIATVYVGTRLAF